MDLIPKAKKEENIIKKRIKFLIRASFLVVILVVVIYPFLPLFMYNAGFYKTTTPQISASEEGALISKDVESIKNNMLVIPKIGVKIDIIGGDNPEYAWSKGAWLESGTSTPDKGSNTVLSAHRFRYLPPHERTFYLLDKLEAGDTFNVYWEGKEYRYVIRDSKIVLPTDVYILDPTDKSIVTLYTCNPIFSIKERLVVTAELMDVSKK